MSVEASWADSLPNSKPEAQIYQNSDYFEAKQLLGQRRWSEAVVVLRGVLKRSPEFTPAAVGLASALAYSNRREEALSILNQSIARERGKTRDSLIERSRVLSKIFLTQATFQLYQDGLNLLFVKKTRLAQEKFEKALIAEPDNVQILTRVGQCLLLQGDHDSASERLRLARRLNSYEPEIRLWLGRALSQRGELKEALQELSSARLSLADSETAAIWFADALESSGQTAAAIQALDESTKKNPDEVEALLEVALLRRKVDPQGNFSRDLRLGLGRLKNYPAIEKSRTDDLVLDVRPTANELHEKIQAFLDKSPTNADSGV